MISASRCIQHPSKLDASASTDPGPSPRSPVKFETRHDKTVAERILGSWRMTSWQIEDLASGETRDAFGPNPHGYISYTADGRVMVLVLKTDRGRPAALVPTNEEKLALYDSMFAYAGTYTVDAEKVVHHIDMSWNQSWTGTSQIRFLRLQGDRLTYVGAPARNPMNGRDCLHTVIFQRSS
jgi:Lipocalin-like domain